MMREFPLLSMLGLMGWLVAALVYDISGWGFLVGAGAGAAIYDLLNWFDEYSQKRGES